MAGYPKIWTFIRHETWWKQLKAAGRGAVCEMLLMIKEQHDNGHLVVSSMSNLAAELSINRKVMSQLVTFLTTTGTLQVVKNDRHLLHLYFPKYIKWQKITVKEAVENAHADGRKCPTTRPDQTIPDQTNKKESPKKSGDHHALIQYWSEKYQSEIGEKYIFSKTKDPPAVKELITTLGLEKSKQLVDQIFISTDPWYQKAGRSLAILRQNANKLVQEIANHQPTEKKKDYGPQGERHF